MNVPASPGRGSHGALVTRSTDENGDQRTSSSLCEQPTVPKELHLRMFEIGKPLGKGKFGRVYIARTKADREGNGGGFICALKLLYKKDCVMYNVQGQIRREVEIQMNLR